jgi:hypothetical protein
VSDPSLELRLRDSAYWFRKSSDKTMKPAAALQDEAAARIRELEERLHERDLAVAAMSKKRAEAYRRGVRDGIERVRISAGGPWCGCADGLSIEDTCNAALASYDEEAGRE